MQKKMKEEIQEALESLLRVRLDFFYFFFHEKKILRYLNPAFLSGDSKKYMKLYNRLVSQYDFCER